MIRQQRHAAIIACATIVLSACGTTAYEARVAGEQAPPADAAIAAPSEAGNPQGTDDASEVSTAGPQAPEPGVPSSSDAPDPSGTQPVAPTTSPAPGPSGQPAPTPQPSTQQAQPLTTNSALPQTSENGRGVTETDVNVGFIILTSFQNLGGNLGFSVAEKGDQEGQIRALSDWINDNGGLAGRNINPIIRIYTQEEASPGSEAQLCNAFADDDNVFAMVLQGQIHQSTRECYAGKGIIAVDPTSFIFDDDLYAQLNPYLWQAPFPNYSQVMRTLPNALDGEDFFEPMASRNETEVKIGVLHWDTPSGRRVLETDLKPALASVGQETASTYGVDGSSVATIQNGLSNAITQFRAAGVNRMFFIGGAPLAPFFFSTAEADGYRPRYAMTSMEEPRHTASDRGTPAQMADAVGIG